ncbi:hypothetical protein G4B88_012342 [Cannabis sativa]|uniref:Ninja-family protein n=1 Tax=Cannabis sativa TaxID=3483 RepID=A0A7J6I4Q2_CANSA|nr:hypothetical protein G4B88_012342 [Cannabis sativa]
MAEVEREKIELELGLSIGGRGSFGKYKTTKKPNIGFNLETREISTSPAPAPEREVLDAKTKREIHAMRRQEAKKKRQEKRNRGLRNSNNISPVTEDQNQDRDDEQRASKKRRYPYPSFQFVPYTNGFPYPYMMMPWWTPNAGSTLKNAVQPMPCRVGFGPFYTGSDLGSDKSGEKTQGEDRKTTSYGGYTSSSTHYSDSNSSETTTVSESVVETREISEGPNGKRVTGFLHRYAKSEVNICFTFLSSLITNITHSKSKLFFNGRYLKTRNGFPASTNFNVSSSSPTVFGNWAFRFSVNNPKKKMNIAYDSTVSFFTNQHFWQRLESFLVIDVFFLRTIGAALFHHSAQNEMERTSSSSTPSSSSPSKRIQI